MDNNDELIRLLTQRVYHLEQEVIKLGGQPYRKQNTEPEKTVNAVANENNNIIEETYVKPDEKTVNDFGSTISSDAFDIDEVNKASVNDKISHIKAEQNIKSKEDVTSKIKNHTRQSMENRIGKNVMGIMASILIFFSLVLFAGIAFNYLSDIAKVIIMFAVSIAIAAFGIIKMPKKNEEGESKYKIFFTTIAACGTGAVYITDLVAYFGFKCMPLVPFIISLAVWLVITMFLAYKCSSIFVYISNIGLIIATFLTAVQFSNGLLGFVIYTVCLTALYFIDRHEDFNRDCFYFIQYPAVFIALSFTVDTTVMNYVIFTVLICGVFVAANVLYSVTFRQAVTNLITAVLNIGALIRICYGINDDTMTCIAIVLLVAMMALYFIEHYKTNRYLFYIIYYLAYVVSVCMFYTTDLHVMISLAPFILFLVAGFIFKDVIIRIGGYIALIVSFMVHMDFYETWFLAIVYFAVIAAAAFAVWHIHYTIADKYILTATVLVYLAKIGTVFSLDVCIEFALYAIAAAFMNHRLYHTDYETGEDEPASRIIGYIISGMMILSGLVLMCSKDLTPELYKAIIISLITLALCVINTKRLYATVISDFLLGVYICIKFSLWIYAALFRLDAASFIISIAGIIVAIICIVLGFSVKQKAFRLYGLVVSLISVIKLILFDISYDSNILRPLGFFIAGVLCFTISFIYSKLEKGIHSEEK